MKKKIETICIIIVLILSITNIKLCTDAINVLSDNTEKKYISQGDIKSKQYLVQDGYISRITPKTEKELFIEQIGIEDKEIKIYKDKEKIEEVKEGLVATGMVMTLAENTGDEKEGIDYELSIVGDINRDGKANIVEVVQIINHIVGFEGKELIGLSYMSGDINGDNEINIIDASKLIRYIVFEELEIGEVEWEEEVPPEELPPKEEVPPEELPPKEEEIPEKEIGKIYAIEDLVDLATLVNNGTFEEEYKKVHGEEAEIVVTLERNLDFKDVSSYRTENPETTVYTDAEGNGIDANGDGTVEPIMVELTTRLGFMPIGTMNAETGESISFKGNFDGKENIISNLYINRPEEFTVGFFGLIEIETGKTVEIKDIAFTNAKLQGGMIQGIISAISGEGKVIFSNCDIEGANIEGAEGVDLEEGGYAGGLIGMPLEGNSAIITDCEVRNTTIKASAAAAGIACGLGGEGKNLKLTMNNCNVLNSEIIATEGSGCAAGIVASVAGGEFQISNSYVMDSNIKGITKTNWCSGVIGFCHTTNKVTVDNCFISGVVVDASDGYDDYNGSVTGILLETSSECIKINNCYTDKATISGKSIAVGICGSINGNIEVSNCYNTNETILKAEEELAGIIGPSYGEINIINCYNSAVFETTENGHPDVGGIISSDDNSLNLYIDKCTNLSDIQLSESTDGAGIANVNNYPGSTLTIMNCANYGNISGNEIAGITFAGAGNIYNCYNVGELSGDLCAGIVYNDAVVNNCYNLGKIDINFGEEFEIARPNESTIINCHSLTGNETPAEKQTLLSALNINREDKTIWSEWVIIDGKNNGYPVFSWDNNL